MFPSCKLYKTYIFLNLHTQSINNISVDIVLSQISGLNNLFTLFETETTPGSENVSYSGGVWEMPKTLNNNYFDQNLFNGHRSGVEA